MSSRQKKNQQILDERREQFLMAALKVFARRGFVATKISDIATEAGLSHGLIYHYFKSKDEIYTELIKRAFTDDSAIVFDEIRNLDMSPIEKLQTIINMAISGTYRGTAIYYWHIIMQASISEAVPDEVRRIVCEYSEKSDNSIIQIIKEGQEQNQVILEDPHKLAGAFYSIFQGMHVLQILGKNTADHLIHLPDPDMILRFFKNPEGADKQPKEQVIKHQFGNAGFKNKTLVYKARESLEDEFNVFRVRTMETIERGNKAFRIESIFDSGRRITALINAENWSPLKIEFYDEKGNKQTDIEYSNNKVVFDLYHQNLHKEIELSGEYYDFNTLNYVLQGYPFETVDKILTTVILDEKSSKRPIGPYKIGIKKTGRETITVPAGSFDCYKVIGYPVGFKGIYSEYWYSVEKPSLLVKLEGTIGNIQELVRFE